MKTDMRTIKVEDSTYNLLRMAAASCGMTVENYLNSKYGSESNEKIYTKALLYAYPKFCDWVDGERDWDNLRRLQPLKRTEFEELMVRFGQDKVKGVLMAMDDWKPIIKRKSIYKTALNWLTR